MTIRTHGIFAKSHRDEVILDDFEPKFQTQKASDIGTQTMTSARSNVSSC
jgi:hypothetical protein